jgi:hypothetical protein
MVGTVRGGAVDLIDRAHDRRAHAAAAHPGGEPDEPAQEGGEATDDHHEQQQIAHGSEPIGG